ncbi:ABC transporter permease subunit [Pelagibacterium sp. H642]|uniref:ABC transporter permease n=1 Tax=Pelagibacterium sp. H642 TaxID=1881069 RepID=UPI00281686A0|nr:ABC transporter permease subunit [Pelagibacterium sp. H642]WMT89618.1 ABC transporter permease subunit [Pelagibacterium sp. H642]
MESEAFWLFDWLGEDFAFWFAYLTNGKHLSWYASFRFTITAAIFGAVLALVFGVLGATAKSSRFAPLRVIGTLYTNMVRGIPDVLFFLFFPLAFEQGVEWVLATQVCTPETIAATQANWPPCNEANWILSTDQYLALACLSLGIIYGAFAANVIYGAMRAVPSGQLEAACAYGLSEMQVLFRIHIRQMWVYALPGLSNVWMLLIKATSLLSLLQIADIVWWAGQLGSPNFLPQAGLVHGDWRWAYFIALFVFYILVTLISEKAFGRLTLWARRGMPVEG